MAARTNTAPQPAPDIEALVSRREFIAAPEFFQSVLDGIQDAIKIVDPDYRIVYANKASEARSGKFMPELIGKTCFREFYHKDGPCAFCHTKGAFQSGQKAVSAYEMPGKDGLMQYLELTSYPIKDEAGRVRYVIEITKDVTERKRLEQQLLHSERLASMGTLASSLAHEINNPLSAILGFTQDLLTETEGSDPRAASLKIIEAEAIRCGRVLQRLLNFARAHPPEMTATDPGKVLQTVAALVKPQAKKSGIEVRLKLPKTLPSVHADAHQLEQLFLNLVLNAMHAMPQGGKLTLEAAAEKQKLRLTVTDTGTGIDPADLPRVFDPFFSRKGEAGTGLGLAICQRIAHAHRGVIRLESAPGKGTRAEVELPVMP
jgi:PAS domain S-box-containing protein